MKSVLIIVFVLLHLSSQSELDERRKLITERANTLESRVQAVLVYLDNDVTNNVRDIQKLAEMRNKLKSALDGLAGQHSDKELEKLLIEAEELEDETEKFIMVIEDRMAGNTTLTPGSTSSPVGTTAASDTDLKIVCYWLMGNGALGTVDAQTCTHLHFSFVTLSSDELVMHFAGGEAEVKDLLALKSQNPNLKVIAALGGGGDGADGKYGRMVTNAQSRANFVSKAVEFLNQHQFDGLDFDWEYPACPLTVCDDKHAPEKAGFASVLKELRAAFDKSARKLSLSVAVNAGKWLTDKAYDYQTMATALDYINVMTYDNAGQWDKVTTHNAGMDWVKNGMNFWASQGVPKSKLLLGIPFYGISFSLSNAANHGLDAPVSGTSGAVTYHQICNQVKHEGWTKERTKDGPIAYHGSQWVGYDDPISAAAKAKWAKDNGFGGVMIWEVEQDDTRADCCKTAKPMMKALGYAIHGTGSDPNSYGCE